MLDDVIIQEGDFTDDYFHKNEWWKDLPEVVGQENASLVSKNASSSKPIDYEQALLEAEGDENDAAAAIAARKEMAMDDNEFEDSSNNATPRRQLSETPSSANTSRVSTPVVNKATSAPAAAPVTSNTVEPEQQQQQAENEEEEEQREVEEEEEEEEDGDMQLNVGHVDQYMLSFWEREVIGVNLGFGGFE
jgi:helicase SWR1